MRSSTFLLLIGVIFTVYYCDASRKEAEISEELDLSGSGEKQDKEALQEGKPDSSQGTETELKELNDKKKKNSNPTSAKSAQGSKRVLPALAATVLKNPKIQEAVVDKGLEVMNKLVDKQLQIIDEAQEKSSNFLAKEIKLDITPDKGWSTPDMFVPPGYHIDASLSGVEKPEKDQGDVPYTYAPNTGVGYVMMNGCWGTNYTANDPCYNSKTTSTICTDMIDGAAFLGVGFDGRGEYSPESRKMSIVQRNCQNKATYDDLDVPDTMNVHGIYDTSATMRTFESRSEFQTYLQQEAGVSGSYFGFYAGAKKAWGSSSSGAGQQFMSILDIDVDRYEIFMDEVKPEDLSLAFLREFLSLPRSYFDAGAPIKFQNFIQRWGTHFIKSAKFGGELEIRKTMTAQEAGSKSEFSEKMEFEYKTLFASVGAKYEKKGGTSTRQQSKTTSTEIEAKGGSQDIASILSDVYSPTFKTEFKEWLQSIPKYPKAFKFLMGSVADLVNFRANDLFPDEKVNWGCEGRAAEMETDKDGRKFYYTYLVKGTKTKTYCEYDSRQSLEAAIKDKRASLKRAIEIYMEEGPVSLSDAHLEKCPPDAVTTPTTKPTTAAGNPGDQWLDQEVAPKWEELIRGGSTFQVTFDMMEDLMNPLHSTFSIAKNMKRNVRYRKGKWYTSDNGNTFHMYNGFSGATGDPQKHKMTILGLTLSYNEKEGSLFLDEQDYTSSKKVFPALSADLKGIPLARVESVSRAARASKRNGASSAGVPCHAEWSNILRMDLKDKEGKCLHFTAASSGTIYVVFSASPKNPNARYVVEMSPQKVAIFKGTAPTQSSPSTAAIDAVALGESVLYESYFVCITISGTNTLIEYGKNQGTKDAGDVYLNMIDNSRDFDIRFYAFGNKDVPVNIMDAHMVSHNRTDVDCKGETMKDSIENLCTAKNCHDTCNPVAGCTAQNDAKNCHDCRVAKMLNPARCVEECPADYIMNKNKECVANYELKADMYGYYWKNPIPVGQELSFCTWAKFGEAPQSDNNPQVNLMQITAGHSMGVRASLDTEGTDVFFELYYKATAGDLSQKIKVNILKDQKWHQVCILWSSTTTAWSMYLDGNREAFGTYENFLQQRIEGKLGVAMPSFWSKLLITQLNIWDRVLTSQEIAAFAGTCNQGIGNVLSWSDLYDDTKSSEYNKPSTCHVNALALSTAHSTAEPVTTAQPVTTTSAPPGKREVRKRGRLYRQKL